MPTRPRSSHQPLTCLALAIFNGAGKEMTLPSTSVAMTHCFSLYSVQEFMNFTAATISDRTSTGQRQSVESESKRMMDDDTTWTKH